MYSKSTKTHGRPYTQQEMKKIVEYLVQNHLYSEIKGIKMWKDFASTEIVDRTWQSLKETFIKRILPDINNPFYALSVQQIESFKRKTNLSGNKLEVQKDKEGSINVINQQNSGAVVTIEDENAAGESIQCSKIVSRTRSSTETVVLEPMTDIVQVGLESSEEGVNVSPKKLRDLITYSDPLTPMLQEVLHDFATDDEDEPRMQIVEDIETHDETRTSSSPPNIRQSPTPNNNKEAALSNEDLNGKENALPSMKIKSLKLKKTRKGTWESENNGKDSGEHNEDVVEDRNNINNNPPISTQTAQLPKNITVLSGKDVSSDITTDTPLPNNPEGLGPINQSCETTDCNSKSVDHINTDQCVGAKEGEQVSVDTNSGNNELNNVMKKANIESIANQLNNNRVQLDSTEKSKVDIICIEDSEKSPNSDENHDLQKNNEQEANNNNVENTKEKDVLIEVEDESNKNASDLNPCLQSVSLYAEQFSNAKYSDIEINETNVQSKTRIPDSVREPVSELNTKNCGLDNGNNVNGMSKEINITDSSSDVKDPPKKNKDSRPVRQDLHVTLGFSSGQVGRKRKISRSQLSRHNRPKINNGIADGASESSDTATDSESEDSSAPRSRRQRGRDYLVPKAFTIMGLNNKHGVQLMRDGNQLYPIICAKGSSKYTIKKSTLSDTDEESYDRIKYLRLKQKLAEEKIRADELSRLLKEKKSKEEAAIRELSPILPSKLITNLSAANLKEVKRTGVDNSNTDTDNAANLLKRKLETIAEENPSKVMVTLNNGIQVALTYSSSNYDQTLGILERLCKDPHLPEPAPKQQITPTVTGPVEKPVSKPEVIELQLSSERTTPVDPVIDKEAHETVNKIEREIFKEIEKRDKSEERNTSTENVTVRKRDRTPTPNLQKEAIPKKGKRSVSLNKSRHMEESNKSSVSSKRPTRIPQRYGSDAVDKEQSIKIVKSRKSASTSKLQVHIPEDDPTTRYKFAKSVPVSKNNSRSSSNSRSKNKKQIPNEDFGSKIPSINVLANVSLDESIQDYQDSDISPKHINNRRKKINTRPGYLADDDTNWSVQLNESSSNSDVHKTDSYQLLFPKIHQTLALENKDASENQSIDCKPIYALSPLEKQIDDSVINPKLNASPYSEGNSSTVSPELSIVENISISKDLLEIVEFDDPKAQETDNKSLRSYTDNVMERDCELYDIQKNQKREVSPISESLISEEVYPVKIDATSLSDTLNFKLNNLVLESAKKIASTEQKQNDDIKMDVDTTLLPKEKSKKSKRRCSTPLRNEPMEHILEEHVEYNGKMSVTKSNAKDNVSAQNEASSDKINVRGRNKNKKDIIKVKITRPKNKKQKDAENKEESITSNRTMSDSSLKVTGSGSCPQDLDDDEGVHLTHNHSDTCLHPEECVSICENTVTLNQNAKSKSLNRMDSAFGELLAEPVLVSDDDAQVSPFVNEPVKSKSSNSVYLSAQNESYNSIMTEDLDEVQEKPSKWYLLSEDEATTNSNFIDICNCEPDGIGRATAAYLEKLFPITCAIPNLSTVTEMSADSRNPTLDTDAERE